MRRRAPSTAVRASRRPWLGLVVSEAVSATGTRISMIAIPLFVLAETGSATRTGLVALAEMLPLVLGTMLCGPWLDRLGAARVGVGCDLASVVAVGAIPVAHEAGLLPFGVLLALVAAAGALRGPGGAARQALVPAAAERGQVPLERVTGLLSSVERAAGMLGAVLAGVLVAAIGPADAIAVDAASFAVAGLLLAWASTGGRRPRDDARSDEADETAEPDEEEGYLARLRGGAAFLRRDRLLVALTAMLAATNMIDVAWVTVLLPVWAVWSGQGAAALGVLLGVFSGSAALGGLAAATWGDRLPRGPVLLVALLLAGPPRYLLLALDPSLSLLVAGFVVGGLASGFVNPLWSAIKLERIPAPLVGRVSSLVSALCFSLMPLGGLAGGLLVTGAGLVPALVTGGLLYLGFAAVPLLVGRRELAVRPGGEVEVPAPRAPSD